MNEDNDFLKGAELFLSDWRGIYIPQNFANEVIRDFVAGVSDEDWEILEAGPDHEEYWAAWDNVLHNAEITQPNNQKYSLWQDGDLWLVPVKNVED